VLQFESLARELVLGLQAALAEGLLIGLAGGLVFGFVNVVVTALGDSDEPHSGSPWRSLTTDRAVTLVRTSIVALVLAHLGGFLNVLSNRPVMPRSGIVLGFLSAAVLLSLSAWGSWLLFARLWFPLTGRLPWRPKRFLEDAYDRGVLRQAGAAFQFRHAQLRDHLAEHRETAPGER
jgi:hypothetical protein